MVTEFSFGEVCTATIHAGESYTGPIHVGYYSNTDEAWIECEGRRINLPAAQFDAIVKQMRRANKIAKEKAE